MNGILTTRGADDLLVRGHYRDPETGELLRRVTSLANDAWPKPALIGWTGKMNRIAGVLAAERGGFGLGIDDAGELLAAYESKDRQVVAAMRTIYRDADALMSVKRDFGSAVHAAISDHVLGVERAMIVEAYGEEIVPALRAFDRFEEDFAPRWIASEAVVVNAAHGYAGTVDLVGEIDGRTFIVDAKTGNAYATFRLQLAAYCNATRFVVGPPFESVPLPWIDGAIVLGIKGDHYEATDLEIDAADFDAFLRFGEAARYASEADERGLGGRTLRRVVVDQGDAQTREEVGA